HLPRAFVCNLPSCNVLLGGVGAGWLLRHVRPRVRLTRLQGCEPSPFAAPVALQLPAVVFALEALQRQRDDGLAPGAGKDDVHTAGPGSGLEVGEEAAAILGARGREWAG